MTLPVWVEQVDGAFTAAVVGAAGLSATAATRADAVAAVRALAAARAAAGHLVLVDLPNGEAEPEGLLALAGRYADDDEARQMWDDVVAEAYRRRDEEKAREFPG